MRTAIYVRVSTNRRTQAQTMVSGEKGRTQFIILLPHTSGTNLLGFPRTLASRQLFSGAPRQDSQPFALLPLQLCHEFPRYQRLTGQCRMTDGGHVFFTIDPVAACLGGDAVRDRGAG
jgi:hypothetical protein